MGSTPAIMSGRLEFIQAPNLFQYLEMDHKTVTLRTLKDETERCFYFLEGKIVWASSPSPGEHFGDALVRGGMLSQVEMERCLSASQSEGLQLTAYLLKNEILDHAHLEKAAEIMTRRVIFGTFRDQQGDFVVFRGIPSEVRRGRIRLSPQRLVVDFFQEQLLQGEEVPDEAEDADNRIRWEALLQSPVSADGVDLGVLPDTAIQLLENLKNPDADRGEINRMILSSPELTARILRVANSPFLGVRGEVDSIPQAIALLGFRRITQLVLTLSLRSARAGKRFQPHHRELRTHSIKTAFFARDMAFLKGLDVEDCFLLGLLSQLGVIVALEVLERRLDKGAIERAEQDEGLVPQLKVLAPDVLDRWRAVLKLPTALIDEIIVFNGAGREIPPRLSVIRLADHLAGTLSTDEPERLVEQLLADSELSPDTLGPEGVSKLAVLFEASLGLVRTLDGLD